MPRAAWRPALRGKRTIQIGQVAAGSVGVGAVLEPIIGLGIAGAATYIGIRVGVQDTGVAQWLGWIVGISGAIAVLTTIADLYVIGSDMQKPEAGPGIVQQTTSPGTVEQP